MVAEISLKLLSGGFYIRKNFCPGAGKNIAEQTDTNFIGARHGGVLRLMVYQGT
jgi:hypothetical protein